MKITRIESFLMKAGSPEETGWAPASEGGLSVSGTRHWCFVRVTVEDGTYGIGEGSGWPKLVRAGIDDLAPLLLGEDARHIERLWAKMHLATMGHGLTGTPGSGAMTALEMALWDLNGKLLAVPVWRLLGGKIRDAVPAYAHTSSIKTTREFMSAGYRAFKTGGVATAVEKARDIRAEFGRDIDLMVDLHGPPWMTPADAKRVARSLEPLDLLFLEEPVSPELPQELATIRATCGIPISSGERTAKLWGLAPLITSCAIDVAQPDTGRFGGLSQMKKIAAVAEAYGVTIAPHAGTLGPVAEFAALHLMASIPNALILERFGRDWPGRSRVVTAEPVFCDGELVVPDEPGLGVDLDLDEIARYPADQNCGVPNYARHCAEGTQGHYPYIQPRRFATGFGRLP